MRERNFQIENIGLYYMAHYGKRILRLCAKDFAVDIPINRIHEFCDLFPDVDWEDGAFLEVLKGRYMRVLIDKDIVVGLKHITKELVYMVKRESE